MPHNVSSRCQKKETPGLRKKLSGPDPICVARHFGIGHQRFQLYTVAGYFYARKYQSHGPGLNRPALCRIYVGAGFLTARPEAINAFDHFEIDLEIVEGCAVGRITFLSAPLAAFDEEPVARRAHGNQSL